VYSDHVDCLHQVRARHRARDCDPRATLRGSVRIAQRRMRRGPAASRATAAPHAPHCGVPPGQGRYSGHSRGRERCGCGPDATRRPLSHPDPPNAKSIRLRRYGQRLRLCDTAHLAAWRSAFRGDRARRRHAGGIARGRPRPRPRSPRRIERARGTAHPRPRAQAGLTKRFVATYADGRERSRVAIREGFVRLEAAAA
jgi:hypothetical protein